MDAVGLFRKRRRLQSEEEGLSLTEYLRGKQEVDSGPAGKRVSISVWYVSTTWGSFEFFFYAAQGYSWDKNTK